MTADTANLTAENIKLKVRVMKLKQIQIYNDNKKHIVKLDNDIRKIKQINTFVLQKKSLANINASCKINFECNPKQIDLQYDNTFTSDMTNNISNSDIYQKTTSYNKEIEFLNWVYKETVSKVIRERNQKMRLQQETAIQNLSNTEISELEQDNEYDKNQIVEQKKAKSLPEVKVSILIGDVNVNNDSDFSDRNDLDESQSLASCDEI
ncbi:16258_t:CDS:2 [Racocetra fulgida]|uniref:16258_t:CDS:1 n=1 Tax=Racocetra fulgida TaxID=60492 RepID=A0A9N8Z0L9_9GLOM|nr:16258_t:CDS:2 [Racocetra fulgida]